MVGSNDAAASLAKLTLADGAAAKQESDGDSVVDDWDADIDSTLRHAEEAVAAKTASAALAAEPKPAAKAGAGAAGGRRMPEEGQEEDEAGPSRQAVPIDELPFCGAHIFEVTGISKSDRQQALEDLAESLCCEVSPSIRRVRCYRRVWVDEGHALLVFSDPRAARDAQQRWPSTGSRFGCRPFIEASAAAKQLPASDLQPAKRRPRTTSVVARRLIGSALNMSRELRDRGAERELADERRQRQGARREQQQRKHALDAAWDD